jgi:uncharacterized protein
MLTGRHAALWKLVEQRLLPGELAHDAQHVLRVLDWSLRLAPEAGADPDLAGAAALVHDLVFVPKDSADRAAGGERSAAAAPAVLAAAGYEPDEIAQVAEAVRTSSWSRGLAPTGPLGAVLQDADRLDAIGALGLLRNVACAQHMAKPGRGAFYEPADPLARSGRALDDKAWATDHLFAKLLRLAAGMHTAAARAEAERRHAFLLDWLAELERELNSATGTAVLGDG